MCTIVCDHLTLLLGMILLGIEEGINPEVGVNEDVRFHGRFHPVKRLDIGSQLLV